MDSVAGPVSLHELTRYRDRGKRFCDNLMNGNFVRLSPLAVKVFVLLDATHPFLIATSSIL